MIYLDLDQLIVTQAALLEYLEGLKAVEPSDEESEQAKTKVREHAEAALLAVTLDLARKSQFVE